MAIFEYGKYKIDIDEEKTKKLFDEAKIEDTQSNRNFQKYVAEMMSDEERAFFESLHIDLSKVNILYGYLSRNKKWCCDAEIYVNGKFVSYPETAFVTMDDVKEKGLEILNNIDADDIFVGNFQIHIYSPAPEEYFSEFYEKSDDIVEDLIHLTIQSENLPWLLDEKCKEKEMSKFMEFLERHFAGIIYFIPNIISRKRNAKTEHEKLIEELELLKANLNIEYEILSDKETEEYKKLWVDQILPENVSEEKRAEAYENCLPQKECCTFLWHMFSFEIVETMENPTEEFKKLQKKDCTLIFEANKFFTVKLKNAEDLDEQDIIDLCNSVAGWCDFVITADDFSWAYSRTHEDGWIGPYFYKKN
ncbi:MAG: DUF4275 family protein [Eubacterium sp.]|nr:DUF4275 family protein [Eubacterium sp.]